MQKIKTNVLSRTLSVAKLAVSSGTQVGMAYLASKVGQGPMDPAKLKAIFESEAAKYVAEFDKLKGAIMKIGQMISLYEGILPDEIVQLFKKLRSDSEPVAWSQMEKVLKRSLTQRGHEELVIDPTPVAAASIGQVHVATRKSDGRKIALKIQYPRIAQAVDSDIAALRKLLGIFHLLQHTATFDQVIDEIRISLKAEMDYVRELAMLEKMRRLVGDNPCLSVPEAFPEYSSRRILATEYCPGTMFDSPDVRKISPLRKQRLASHLAEIFLHEIFNFHLFQSDPHFGNYIVQLDPAGENDRVVMIDFGATMPLSDNVVDGLRQMIAPFILNDKQGCIEGLERIGALYPDDPPDIKERYVDLVLLHREMLGQKPSKTASFLYDKNGVYRWENTDIIDRAKHLVFKLSFDLNLRPPPRDFFFLGRKGIGVFMMLRTLGARLDTIKLLTQHLPEKEKKRVAAAYSP